jgi:hypothetical protein
LAGVVARERMCVRERVCVLGHTGSREGRRVRVCVRLATAEQIEGLGAAAGENHTEAK